MALLLACLEQQWAKDDQGNDDDDEPLRHDGLGTRTFSSSVDLWARGA